MLNQLYRWVGHVQISWRRFSRVALKLRNLWKFSPRKSFPLYGITCTFIKGKRDNVWINHVLIACNAGHRLTPRAAVYLRVHDQRETHFNVSENVIEYLVFWYSEGWVIVIRVGAGMDDTIHVKIKIIKLWYLHKKASRSHAWRSFSNWCPPGNL